MSKPLDITSVKEVGLYVKDLDRSKAFYHDLLGFPVISHVPNRHVFFRAGDTVLLCFIAETTKKDQLIGHYAEGKQHIAFEAKEGEYEAWKDFLKANDIELLKEITWGNGKLSVYFEDPDGHMLEVIENKLWGF